MLFYSIRLLIHYLKFGDVPIPYQNQRNYFRLCDRHCLKKIQKGDRSCWKKLEGRSLLLNHGRSLFHFRRSLIRNQKGRSLYSVIFIHWLDSSKWFIITIYSEPNIHSSSRYQPLQIHI